MGQTDFSPGAAIGLQLKQTQAALRSRMDGALREIGLTTPQYACLEWLAQMPGISNAELARRAFVTRQTMNTLLRALRDRGLVTRAEEAPVGRALPTRLTPDGETLLRQAADRTTKINDAMVENLTPAQLAALREGLAACATALDEEA